MYIIILKEPIQTLSKFSQLSSEHINIAYKNKRAKMLKIKIISLLMFDAYHEVHFKLLHVDNHVFSHF